MAIDFENINTIDLSNLKIIPKTLKGLFSGCSGLTKIDGLSKLNTSEVIDMSRMFVDCEKLQEIDLSNFNTYLVRDMSYMFNNCKELKALNLSNFDTSSVINMSYMFADSEGLSSLDLSNFDTSSLKDIKEMFKNCSNLKYLDISNFNLNGKTFESTFKLIKLKYINIYNAIYESSNSNFLDQKSFLQDSIDEGLMVCQKEKIIVGKNVIYGCCLFELFDVDGLKCVDILKLKYGKKNRI